MHPWRERLGRWLTPVARSCPLAPNAISIAALALNLGAAALFLSRIFLWPILLIAIAGFLDALDGTVAREQQKETRFGDFLDHVCDRLSDTALAACWMIGNGVREPLVVAGTILIMLNGYLGTQIEATFGRRNYDSVGRGEFVLALIVFPIASFILFSNGWAAGRFGGATISEWLSAALIAFALLGIVQRFALAARMERS
ncbi:MAG TPA: CDP-alcohol phosphatidyltransferase family protein [Thermoanaerobaculia bacterium]|nr:CDP-alcohol phosphatidyltransferase family protein [Thermoanaerobaculia bacterium]